MELLKSYDDVEPYLGQVQSYADAHKKEFGFLPPGFYRDQALQGKLWVSVDEKFELSGYLIFGGAKPSLKIFQLFIPSRHRRAGVGHRLIEELVKYGVKFDYLSIKARVAADLEANHFWEKAGFFLAGQVPGGKSTKRIINVRVRELETPSLLEGLGLRIDQKLKTIKSLSIGNSPILRSSVYALDLNVFFDLLKNRSHHAEASMVFNAGWNNIVKLCVTPEFVAELRRTSKGRESDPLLRFAQELPQLSPVKETEIERLSSELQSVVFPMRSKDRKANKNDESDLRHLCYAISHGLSGFVTRENAILNARERLLERYGLDIVSPSDFSYSNEEHGVDDTYSIALNPTDGQIDICTCSSLPSTKVDAFLRDMRIESITSKDVWSGGLKNTNERHISVHNKGELVAIGSWATPISVAINLEAFLFIKEESGDAVRVIDHFLEMLLRDVPVESVHRISLIIGKSQTQTLETAVKKGFSVHHRAEAISTIKLVKFAVGGVLDQRRWSMFVHKMKSLAPELKFPDALPPNDIFCNTGVLLHNDYHPVKLFEFENLFSPGIVVPKGREAVLVPIQQSYAEQLIGRVNNQLQLNLLPQKPALICMERAYFRKASGISKFKQGTIVIFYVSASGGGGKELLGWARITSSQLMHLDDVKICLSRQGVLSDHELMARTNKEGKLHAFTFDNFSRFSKCVGYELLKKQGIIDGANLVTAQSLTSKQLEALYRIIF